MEKQPLFTIITVCMNSVKTIHRTFDSVLNQTYDEPLEYIVVDGNSEDGTLVAIKEYESKFLSAGHLFKWTSGTDSGIYDAMNKGIVSSTGQYIGILNSDDYYELTALASIAEGIDKQPQTDVFYGFLRELLPDGEELRIYRNRYENYLMKLGTGSESAAQHPTCFVRRSVYDDVGLFDVSFKTAADYDFLLRVKRANCLFTALDVIVTNFSGGGASQSISDYDRVEQRYRAHFNNGLISEEEYKKLQKRLWYSKYKMMKKRIIRMISGGKE